MEVRERLVLQKSLGFLIENIDIKTVVCSLRNDAVLSTDDDERIKGEVTTGDKVEKFLSIIIRKRKAFEPFLRSVGDYVKDKLQNCTIHAEDIEKEERHLDDFVKEILTGRLKEENKGKVSVSTIEDEVRQQFIDTGKVYRLSPDHLQTLVLATFPTVKLTRSGARRKRTLIYGNLTWKQKDSDEDSSDDELAAKCQTQRRMVLEDMDVDELCKVLKDFNMDALGLDNTILDIFKKENIDGQIFTYLNFEETKEILPDFSFRDRKKLLIMRDELKKMEISGGLESSLGRSKKVTEKEKKGVRKGYVRESLRKFETPVGNLDNYRKSAVLRASVTRPHNLIEPVHLFLSKSQGASLQWITQETVRFASACMNDRTNGTIHFGIERRSQSEFFEGEIVGVKVANGKCKEEIYKAITTDFFDDQIEMALKCIRPVEFVEVINPDNAESGLVVVEIDVVPHSTVVQEEAVFVRSEEGMVLYRFQDDNPRPEPLNEEQKRQYMKEKKGFSRHRKEQEQLPHTVPIQEDLRQKFLNLFSGGCENLAEEMYPVLFLGPSDDTLEFDNFQFINDIEPSVIFDFDSSSNDGSMYHFIEEDKEQVVKVLTTENFDKNKTELDRRSHLFEDLRTAALRPWIFCNGYDVMDKEPMDILEWKRNRSEGFKEALRFYGEEIPNGRAMVIFMLFSKNYDVLLEAAEEVILKFQDQWMLLAPDRDLAENWMSELLRRQSIDKKTMAERCIIGLPWNHVNIMLQQLISPNKCGLCEIPTSKGAYCHLRDKVKNEMYDLEILSRRECDDNEIVKDRAKLQKHRKEVQESFFRGVQVTWWNYWFGPDHVLQRSRHQKLMDILTRALDGFQNEDDCRVAVVNLTHQPGSGGTTSARHLLWDSREKYRCCIVKQITDQTCEQIVSLRNYEDPTTPKPPIVLLDNCDEESVQNLYAFLENRARIAAMRSEVPIKCFCVLLLCTRRTDLPKKTDESVVLLKHELDRREIEWFNKTHELLEQKYRDDNGIDPRLLISFNILKENFNPDYIKSTVQQYVDGIEAEKETYLLLYLAMMNSYDLNFQSVPISAFDTMMSSQPVSISYGLVSPRRHKPKRQWESYISSSLQVLLNRSSTVGLGTNLQALSIINKLLAREILSYLQSKLSMETSSVMLHFLESKVFENQNRSVDQVKKIVKDILKKREQLENGRKEKFSPMLTTICAVEDPDKAAKVLLRGFDMTQDPMIAQQTARLYIDCKNWDEALRFCKIATQMKPNNSYLWDTYGLVYKQQLQQKHEYCLQTITQLTMNDTKEVIQLASKGIDIFHKEQSVSEQEKHSTNDAGYYNEVYLVINLLDLLKVSSPIDTKTLHSILVDKKFEYSNVCCPDLDVHTFECLRILPHFTDVAMRKLEDKATQLKDSAIKNVFLGKPGFAHRALPSLRENVDSYFGEDSDEVPDHLSERDKSDFRRRRIRRLGGRSLVNILALRRVGDGVKKLDAIYNHLLDNMKSGDIEAFDMKSFISVALVMHITKAKCNPCPFEKLVELSRRLYHTQTEGADEPPFLEIYLYLVMLHWPTENRQHIPLFPLGKLPDAMQKWKMAFQKNHPRQRDINSCRLKRETTYFFLGNGSGYDEIVYYEELHSSHHGRYYKGDTVWSQPQTIERLKRLEGILINDGTEVAISIDTAGGNKTQLVVPTSTHIGQRNLWQKRVYFYLGFTWIGPKAFDVSQDDRKSTTTPSQHYYPPSRQQQNRNTPLQPQPDEVQQITEIHDKLRKIEQLKRMRGKLSQREVKTIGQEPTLKKELDLLIKSRQTLFGNL